MWKDIDSFEGIYQVDENGNVRSLIKWNGHKYVKRSKPLVLINSFTTTGYYKVKLCKNGSQKDYKVHRLVAYAFIPRVEGKNNINHKDGNPLNNNVENLEWCTQKENVQHAYDIGLHKRNNITKQELEECVRNRMTTIEISRKYHISYPRVKRFFNSYGLKEYIGIYNIDKEKFKEALRSGKKNREIAKMFNCSSMLVATRRYQMKKGVV